MASEVEALRSGVDKCTAREISGRTAFTWSIGKEKQNVCIPKNYVTCWVLKGVAIFFVVRLLAFEALASKCFENIVFKVKMLLMLARRVD